MTTIKTEQEVLESLRLFHPASRKITEVRQKTNKELYAEVQVLLEQVKGPIQAVQDFADKHGLEVRFDAWERSYIPNSEKIRSEYGEQTYENENEDHNKGRWCSSSDFC